MTMEETLGLHKIFYNIKWTDKYFATCVNLIKHQTETGMILTGIRNNEGRLEEQRKKWKRDE